MSPTENYRQAAIIAQSTLRAVILQLHRNIGEQSIGEVCRYGDELIKLQISRVYIKAEEKGIARPVEICKNEFSSGIAPEEFDTFQSSIVNEGDVLKVSLGVHIDGYTVLAGHTVVMRDPSVAPIEAPLSGPISDAVISSTLATEAVVSLLSSVLSASHPLHEIGLGNSSHGSVGQVIREVVDSIARDFNVIVVPGSKVRRIKRFVAGQVTVRDTLPAVEWNLLENERNPEHEKEADSEFVVKAGQSYVVDIQMAPRIETDGFVKSVAVPHIGSAFDGPSIYCRDQTVRYQLRTQSARALLAAIDQNLSVYPFKLSYLDQVLPLSHMKLGLKECITRHLIVGEGRTKTVFVPEYRSKEQIDVVSAREICTVSLVEGKDSTTGYPELLRLSGGRQFPPSWTHSEHAVSPGVAADALNSRMQQHVGVRYVEIKAKRVNEGERADAEMSAIDA